MENQNVIESIRAAHPDTNWLNERYRKVVFTNYVEAMVKTRCGSLLEWDVDNFDGSSEQLMRADVDGFLGLVGDMAFDVSAASLGFLFWHMRNGADLPETFLERIKYAKDIFVIASNFPKLTVKTKTVITVDFE